MFIVLKTIDWKHNIYRHELTQMTKSEHFEFWKIKNNRHFAVKTELVIQNMNDRVLHLMSFFRVIARSINVQSNRLKKQNHNRWIAIMTNFLYIFMFKSCIFWSTMWNIQLHVNDIKRQIIENLFHTKLYIKYKAILKAFQQLFAHQKSNIRQLNSINNFIVIYDNFEQTMKTKNQRINNKNEFFFVITAQIFESNWLLKKKLKSNMFRFSNRLNWLTIVRHEIFDQKNDLTIHVNANFEMIRVFWIFFVRTFNEMNTYRYQDFLFWTRCELFLRLLSRKKITKMKISISTTT